MTYFEDRADARRADSRLYDLLTQVRDAPDDARDFAWFERRDDLKRLGVDPEQIDSFDARNTAALDQHIARARAAVRPFGRDEAASEPQPYELAQNEAVGSRESPDPTAYTGAVPYFAQNSLRAEQVRRKYIEEASRLAPADSEGRAALKLATRQTTPANWRAIIDAARPGLGQAVGSVDGAARTNAAVDALARRVGLAGRVAGLLSLGMGAWEIASSKNKPRAAAAVATSTGGAIGAGIAGAELGAGFGLLGGPFAPVAVPTGAVLGGIAGSMGGGYYGHKVGEAAYDAAVANRRRGFP